MGYDIIYMGETPIKVTEEKAASELIFSEFERITLKDEGVNDTRMMYFACKLITPGAEATTVVDKFGQTVLVKYKDVVAYVYECSDRNPCMTYETYTHHIRYCKFTEEMMYKLAELIMTTLKKRKEKCADAADMPSYTKEKEECLHEYIKKEYEDMMKME